MTNIQSYNTFLLERRGVVELQKIQDMVSRYIVTLKAKLTSGTKQALNAKTPEAMQTMYYGASKIAHSLSNMELAEGISICIEQNKPGVNARYGHGVVYIYSSELKDFLYNITRAWCEITDPNIEETKRTFYKKFLRKTHKEFMSFDFSKIQNTMVHELVHWLDDQRGGVYSSLDATNRRIDKRVKATPGMAAAQQINQEEYYNSIHEVNAYLMEALNKCLASIKSGEHVCNTFTEFSDFIHSTIGASRTKYYTPKTKERITKRLYNIWQERDF